MHNPLTTLNRSTVRKVEERVAEKGKRNSVSKLFHARNDKETISSWRSDLTRILGVFNVRSIVPVWLLLIIHFQAELAICMHASISAVHHDVMTTQTIVSSVHGNVVNTNTLVSDIHRNILQNQGGTDAQHHLVNVTFCLPITKYSPSPRLKPGQ